MKSKTRFFYITERELGYREVHFFRTKFSFAIAGFATLLLVALLFVNHYYFDLLGLGYNRIKNLTHENATLRLQLRKMMAQMEEVEITLDKMNDRHNELRLLVDLPRIDEDTRRAGIGGAVNVADFGLSSNDARHLLRNSVTILDKISREIQLQKTSYDEMYKRYQYNKDFFSCVPALKPMDGFYSTAGFGPRMHPVLGIYKTHSGLDIINDVGTPVYASGNGVVEYARHSGGGYGNAILINHSYGYQSLYAHLSKVLIRGGARVKRGDLIAYSGKTGLVSGPHLHYEVRYKGAKLNPIDFFLDDITAQSYKQLASTN